MVEFSCECVGRGRARVLAWFSVQLARFIGEAPDLDSLIGFRGSALIYRDGFEGLVKGINGEGVHPPVMDLINFTGFGLFGLQPSSIQLMSIPLFVVFVIGVERLLSRYESRERPDARVRDVRDRDLPGARAAAVQRLARGLMSIILVGALCLALKPGGLGPRPLALGWCSRCCR